MLVGCISSKFTYDHEVFEEKFYRVTVSVKRDSGVNDEVPVIVSEHLIDSNGTHLFEYVSVTGQF